MFYLVYRITNKLNGKFYIGAHQTKVVDDGYQGSGSIIKQAIKKHGIENFQIDIVTYAKNRTEMYCIERFLVDEAAVDDPNCYNIKLGGCGGWDYALKNRVANGWKGGQPVGWKHSPETIAKLREIGRTRKPNRTGAILSEETKRKISESKKGKPSKLKGIPSTGNSPRFKGRRHTEETKAKLRATWAAKKLSLASD